MNPYMGTRNVTNHFKLVDKIKGFYILKIKNDKWIII